MTMKSILVIVSYLGLALTILPSFFLVTGVVPSTTCKSLMLIGTLFWFGTSVFWVGKKEASL